VPAATKESEYSFSAGASLTRFDHGFYTRGGNLVLQGS
jgi:hypothetical protein